VTVSLTGYSHFQKVVNFRLMPRRSARVVAASLFLVLGFAAVPCFAQLVASRDLTSGWRVPSEHITIPETCDKPRSTVIDGGQMKAGPVKNKDLELTIVETTPAKLEIGNDFNATVRLKNVGTTAALIPSTPNGEGLLRPSGDGTEEKYEVGDISFRLTTGKQPGMPVYLNTAGALFADPDDNSSYLALRPGTWLDIRVHARVECGMEDCMGEIEPDSKAVLTAWWYQRVLTHRVSGCEETHGSHMVRELDSAPFPIEVKVPSTKVSAMARNY
jgi:hypothetical protein